MVSVRAAVEPLNTALKGSPTIFLNASFAGLPLVNQALAAENPVQPGRTFVVTLRALIKVLGEIPIAAIVQAVAAANAPPQAPSPPPPAHSPQPPRAAPPVATCQAEMDLDNPGFGGITNIRFFGGGFASGEVVQIVEQGQQVATAKADGLGSYKVTAGYVHGQLPISHIVHAHGESSSRNSNDAGFTV